MLEMCLYDQEDQWYHCVHCKEHGQWVEGGYPSLSCPGEATSGVLHPVLAPH